MADEPKNDDKKPEPTFDPAMIQQAVQDAVKAAMAANQRPAPPPKKAPEDDPLKAVVLEKVSDELGQNRLLALAAADYAKFYTMYPEAKKYHKDIESKFTDIIEAGREPQDRETIWLWYKGLHFDKFREDATVAEKAAQDDAARSTGVGAGAGGKAIVMPGDPSTMSVEELEKALKDAEAQGVTF